MSTNFPGVNTPPAQDEAIDLGTLAPAFSGAMSMTAWIQINQRGPERTIMFGKGDGLLRSDMEWSIGYDGTGPPEVDFILDTGAGGVAQTTSPGPTGAPAWRFLAGTYDGANKRYFQDGVLTNTTAETGNIVGSAKATRIAAVDVAGSPEREVNAFMADCRLYDRALSAAELETMYTLRGVDGIVHGLLHRWQLREWAPGATASGAGATKDSGPGQVNGTPINSPLGAESGLRL